VEIGIGRVAGDRGARGALDQHLDGAVGKLQQLQHIGERADLMDGVGCRIVVGSVLLGGQQDLAVGPHHLFQSLDRLFPPTKSGTIMCGKTTMSRKGSTG
jgi:hypothetical protein